MGRRVGYLLGILALAVAGHQVWTFVERRELSARLGALAPTVGSGGEAFDLYSQVVDLASPHPVWEWWVADAVGLDEDALRADGSPGALLQLEIAGSAPSDLAAVDAALDLAVEAGERPAEPWPPLALQASLDAVQEWIHVGRLLRARALLAASGDPDGPSARDLRAAFAVSRHLAASGDPLAQFVRLDNSRRSLCAARSLIVTSPGPREFLARVGVDPGEDFLHRWHADVRRRIPAVLAVTGSVGGSLTARVWWTVRRPYDLWLANRELAAIGSLLDLPRGEASGRISSGRAGLSSDAAEVLANMIETEASYVHALALTRVGVGLLEERARRGAFPADLSAFDPAMVAHPISGRPMEWVSEDGRRVLRSSDGEDRWVLAGSPR